MNSLGDLHKDVRQKTEHLVTDRSCRDLGPDRIDSAREVIANNQRPVSSVQEFHRTEQDLVVRRIERRRDHANANLAAPRCRERHFDLAEPFERAVG